MFNVESDHFLGRQTGSERADVFLPMYSDIDSYKGNSERIIGFQRIKTVIGNLPEVETINPLILLSSAYKEYKSHSMSKKLKLTLKYVWNFLHGSEHPLIVRRLFPNKDGQSMDGPRSNNITSLEDLIAEVHRFFIFFHDNYSENDVFPEIMIHRVVDAGNPPKIESPFLPFPGGDVIFVEENKFQVRATFGADESVQGFPCDQWTIVFEPNGSISIDQKLHSKKNRSMIPGTERYKRILLPRTYYKEPALNQIQVLQIAEACRRLTYEYGPHRLEFDGTIVDGQEKLVIIESAPFIPKKNPKEIIKEFDQSITKPIIIFQSENDFDKIPSNDLVYVHLSASYFQGNDRRLALTKLATIAKERKTKLVAFCSGNVATQHAARVLMDYRHVVIFIENENFNPNEKIRVYLQDGEVMWERENPIVEMHQLKGRGINRIGGKAFGLQKLEEIGIRTQPYLIIETSLFRRIVEETGVYDLLKQISEGTDEQELRQISQTATRRILRYNVNRIPRLTRYLKRFRGVNFSVRSSATCEDGKYSFAGIFRTFLNTKEKDLPGIILKVLASGVSEEAIRTARVLEINPSQIQIAVIIQKMVDAKKGGTIFTRDLISGNRGVLRIEAVKGLGEKVVDGTTRFHSIVLYNRRTNSYRFEDPKIKSTLSDEEIQSLIDFGIMIEERLKEGPQDIEWAINRSGKIVILQTRPL